jgi:ferritin-like metal-binding protein YciE
MAELTTRDAKLIQYLNEAYGKEKELETALNAHIEMTTRMPYKKRLREHLRETKAHGRGLERRIKQLGGKADAGNVVTGAASKAVSAAKGPLHAVRGTGEQEKMLKNAKTEYSEEHEEIATYTAIEALAEAVHDAETAKLARAIRREEERMANYLARLIPTLTKAVSTAEIPAAERRKATRRRSTTSARTRSSATRTRSARSRSSTAARGSRTRATASR